MTFDSMEMEVNIFESATFSDTIYFEINMINNR